MMDSWKKHVGSTSLLVTLLTIAVAIYLLQILWQVLGLFSDAIIVLFSAWIVSFMLEPLVKRVSRYTHLPKALAAGIIYAFFFGLLILTVVLFIPAITSQIQNLSKTLPKYLAPFPTFLNQVTNNSVSYVENSLPIIPSVAQFLFMLFIIFIISFYLVIDQERLHKELYSSLPKSWHEHIQFIEETIDSTFGSFLRVQLIFGVIAGIATWIVLRVLGINFAASTSVIAGLLTAIPLVGAVLGIIPPVLIAFLLDPARGLLVFVILLAMQQVLFNVIGPKLLGSALKLHPIVVLLSFIVGYKLFGPLGAIFAVPVLGALVIIIHRLSRHFLGENK